MRALSHPGLLVVRRPYDVKAKRFATSIPVDEVRRLRSFLAHRATDDGWRVVIVDEANELNVNAANALLEIAGGAADAHGVPARLLGAGAPAADHPLALPHARPAAARRRATCARAATQALAAAETRRRREADWPALERLAEGSVRAPAGAAGPRAGSSCRRASPKLLASLPRVDWRAVHALADELQPIAAQPRFELFFELLLESLSRLIRAAASGEGAAEDARLAARLIGEARLASFAALWERIAREKAETLALNLDRKSLILETVARLAAAAQDRKPA